MRACVRAISRSVCVGGAEPEIATQVPGSEGAERNGTALGPLMYVRGGGGDSLESEKGEKDGGSERRTNKSNPDRGAAERLTS